jgi:hypothetical protein
MDRRPSDRVLEEWDSVSRNARRPDEAPYPRAVRGSFGPTTLVPLATAALVLAVGVIWLGGREGGVAGPPPASSPSPAASAVTADVSPALTTAPTEPTTEPTPTAEASDECGLQAAITGWEGAAGSRIATIQLTSAGPLGCSIPAVPSARLVDAIGRVLAQVVNRDTGTSIAIRTGDIVTTLASVSNVCGDPPTPPVAIELDLGGMGIVTARPSGSLDTTVPPCNGPGQPSEMEIQGWTR